MDVELQYAPWIEDSDPPDLMTDAEIDAMVDGIADLMGWPKPPVTAGEKKDAN